MTIAAKHMDPVVGVDIHIIMIPSPAGPIPTPLPNPFVGMVMDPFDYAPVIGATVYINGMPRGLGGTACVPLPPHLPLGGPFGPPPPGNEGEIFMGSATVVVDGDAQSFLGLQVLTCQSVGMPSPPRPKGQPGKSLFLPVSTVLCIPMGPPVMIGGPPTITAFAAAATAGAMKLLGGLGKMVRKAQRGAGKFGKAMRKISKKAHDAGDKVADKLKLGDRGRQRVHNAVCTVTGHPVDVATGRVFTDKTDLELPGPLPFVWKRSWSSTSTYAGDLGFGWHHEYQRSLYIEDHVVLYRNEEGRTVFFPPLAPGQEHFDRTERLTLLRDPSELGGSYCLRTMDWLTYRFGEVGRENNEQALVEITNPVRDRIGFGYDARGRLTEITDTAGRSIQLTYDHAGRITALSAPHPDEQNKRFVVVQYGYDERGDLVQVLDALGQPARYAYDHHLLIKETDRNGLSFYFEYDGSDEKARCIHTWGDGGIYDHRLRYDVASGQTWVTNSLGHTTRYRHENGLVVETEDPLGAVTLTEYDEYNQKLKETDEIGNLTVFAYDERGNLTEATSPDGARLLLTYGEPGKPGADRPLEATDALGGVWKWHYDEQSRLLERTDPLGATTRFLYQGARLSAVVDAQGQATGVRYDSSGLLTGLFSPDGGTSAWHYDHLGRPVAATDPNGNEQRRGFDLLGRVTRVREPDGNLRELEYDGEDNIIHARDQHHDVRFGYRGMGRLSSRTEADTTVRFEYDSEEQLTGIVNEHGYVYRFALGPTGEVDTESGFDGIRRVYRRDPAGQVLEVERASGLVSKYGYDKSGRVIGVEHSDGTKESYAYRPDGELIEATNSATGVGFERDALGRIIKETQGEHWVATEYDAVGLRRAMQSSLGAAIQIERNPMGDVLSVSCSHLPSSTGSGPDAHLPSPSVSGSGGEGAVLPSPSVSGSGGEGAVLPSPSVSGSGGEGSLPEGSGTAGDGSEPQPLWKATFERDLLGLEVSRGLPGGVQSRWQRDKLGRPVSHEIWSGAKQVRAVGYQWEPNDRLRRVVDALKGPTTYTHDALGNLASAAYPDGTVEWRMPDAVGNLFKREDRGDRKYGRAGELLESTDPRGRVTSYAYDAEGNLKEKRTADGELWQYEWDAAGMLSRVTRPDGTEVTFQYDALGRRISKSYRGQTTRWVWDGNVPLHEWVEGELQPRAEPETAPLWQADPLIKKREAELSRHLERGPPERGTPDAPITWLFEPESFAPIAKLGPSGNQSIVTDYLGTPVSMLDDSGEPVWSANINTFGKLRDLEGDAGACPFRWPGQYEDAETGLYYNRFRYYDSDAGQYASQDPIGLRGGRAFRVYVGDPLVETDPLALAKAGKCGNMSGDDLEKAVQKKLDDAGIKYRPNREVGAKGEIDIETDQAIIEITRQKKGKRSQVKNKYINDPDFNPGKKPVILFAPDYNRSAAKEVEDVGALVVNDGKTLDDDLETLVALLK